jgi:hypothetical protein
LNQELHEWYALPPDSVEKRDAAFRLEDKCRNALHN